MRLHRGRRHEPDLVAESSQLTRPDMSGGACLHADQARWQAAEEADDLAPAELTTDHNLSALVKAVDLKDVLGEVKGPVANSPEGRRMGWTGPVFRLC